MRGFLIKIEEIRNMSFVINDESGSEIYEPIWNKIRNIIGKKLIKT